MIEDLKKQEVKEEGVVDTLTTNEPAEAEEESIPELNSSANPTPEQVEESVGIDVTEEIEGENSPVEEEVSESVEIQEAPMTEEQEAVEQMLTQSQVNDLIGRTRTETRDKTRAETLSGVYGRYGVNDEGGLDEIVGRSQKYDMLHDDYDHVLQELNEAKIKLAMYDSGIAPERYEDARLILQGKGLDVTADNIRNEMATHPEWEKKFAPQTVDEAEDIQKMFKPVEKPVSTITRLGNERPETQSGISERDIALNLFK